MKELLSWTLGIAGLVLLGFALRPLCQRFNDAVFTWMDGFYLTPMKIKLGKGERVEMVALKSRVLAVWEPLLKRGAASLLLGTGVGVFVAAVVLVIRAALDPERFLTSEGIGFAWWLIPTGIIATGLPVLLYTYYVEEWNRRHFRYIMLTGTTWVARVRAPEGTPYLSFGPSVLLEEAKVGSPGERVGKEAPSLIGRIWDGILWRWRRVAYIYLPTRVFGAADVWDGIEWAFGTLKILMFIAGQARERAGLTEAAMKAWHGARLEEVQAGEGLFFEAGKAAEILAAYNRLAPEGPEADLLLVEDPGLYDRRAWDIGIGAPVVARPAPPTTLAEFPEA